MPSLEDRASSRGFPPGLMGYVSPLYSDGTCGFESVPAPPGALSFFMFSIFLVLLLRLFLPEISPRSPPIQREEEYE